MSRALRLLVKDGWYHVTAWGNERRAIFRGDRDCGQFLAMLGEMPERYGVRVAADGWGHKDSVGHIPKANGRRAFRPDLEQSRHNFSVPIRPDLIEERLPDGSVLARSHDDFGRASGIALGGAYAVVYGYDAYGRFGIVTSSVSAVSSVVSYSYIQGSDLLTGWSSNGGMNFHRPYETNRDFVSAVTNSWNGTTVSSFAYENDALGRRTARTDNGSVTNLFGYNLRSEVASAFMGANEFGYQYDPIGNRLVATNNAAVTTYTANKLNQYTNVVSGASVTPVYDDDGNMTAYGPWAYTWDGENRLIDVTSNSVAIAANAYDYASRRVAKTANGIILAFVYDGWNLIRETAGTNTTHYVWGLDLSQSLQGAGGVGGLLAVVRNGAAYYPAYDANGNITDTRTPPAPPSPTTNTTPSAS